MAMNIYLFKQDLDRVGLDSSKITPDIFTQKFNFPMKNIEFLSAIQEIFPNDKIKTLELLKDYKDTNTLITSPSPIDTQKIQMMGGYKKRNKRKSHKKKRKSKRKSRKSRKSRKTKRRRR